MSWSKKLAYGAAAAAIMAAAPAAVYAQQTTAQLRGVIIDGSGNPVSGATVTVEQSGTGRVSTAFTSGNGTYFLTGLRPGSGYVITVTGNGDTVSQDGVTLTSGQPEIFNAVLGASSPEQIIITGTAISNELQLNGGVGSVFTAEDLATQPSIQRDVISSIVSDPLVTSTNLSGRSRNNGAISIAGQPPRFNGFVIDGLAQQNDFGLDQGLFPTLRQPISIDWIQEASVQVSDYSVLANGFTGGLVNVVTKSGTNEIDGGVYFFTFDDSFVGDEAFDSTLTSEFSEDEWGAFVGGPIVEDQLFYFVGYEKIENEVPLNFDTGDVDGQVFDIIRDIMQTTYNYDPGAVADTAVVEESIRYTARVDWNINEDHALAVSFTHSEDSVLSNAGTFNFPTNYYIVSSDQDVYRAELTSDWTDNFSTIMRFAHKEYIRGQDSLGDTSATGTQFGEFTIEDVNASDPYFTNNGLDGAALMGSANVDFALGPDVFRHHNAFNDERTSFYFQGDYVWDDHLITFGAQYEQYELFNVFGQYSRGEFVFDGLQGLADQEASINYINAFSNNSDDVIAAWGYDQLSLFAQDSWQVSPTFNVNFGIRYDRIYQDDVPPAPEDVISVNNPDVLLPFETVYGFSGQDTLDGVDLIQPRVGFNWDASDRLTLSGGLGIYSGGNPQVWISNNYNGATGSFFGFDATGVDIGAVPSVLQGIIANGITPATRTGQRRAFNPVHNVDVLDPSFNMPYVTRASLRADYNLDLNRWGLNLGDDYRVSASLVYGKQNESLIWRNLAFERDDIQRYVGVAPDGRPLYPDLGDVADRNALTNSSREFRVPDAFMITTAEGGDSLAFALQVAKDYDNGFGFAASYSYQDVEDLLEYTSSRAVSAWRGIVGSDRNNPAVGTSSNEVEHKFTARFTYERDFFQDLTSNFTLFGIMQSGTPYSFGYNVSGSTPIFGRANGGSPRDGADLLYVPIIDGNSINDPRVRINGDEQAFIDYFRATGLDQYQGQIVPRNSHNQPWFQRWDFQFQQELPGIRAFERYVGENRAVFVLDIENLPNLINSDWGTVTRGPAFGRAAPVNLAMESAGPDGIFGTGDDDTFLSNNEPGEQCRAAGDCRYVYSGIGTDTADEVEDLYFNDLNNSVYRIRVGIRYEF
jgi:outer membrane receptor for ferrienterochelin and colicin